MVRTPNNCDVQSRPEYAQLVHERLLYPFNPNRPATKQHQRRLRSIRFRLNYRKRNLLVQEPTVRNIGEEQKSRLSHKGSHFFIFVEKKEKILGTNRRHNSCNQQ
jgi:hypothetical protein